MRVGLYLRISDDLAGLRLGVQRQEADCKDLCARRQWTAATVYCDNDVSAYKRVRRPEFERLLDDLANGAIDGLAVYDLDRLARRNADLERLIDLYDRRPLVFATVQGDIDLSTPDGRTMARVMVAFANKASMDTSRRVARKHLELARNGVPVGGNRPFGYKADKVTIERAEAALIRKAAADVLAGVGLHTICRRWNERGILTTRGNRWQKQVLRNMLLSPRMAGYRVYKGGIARHENGTPVTGLFKPVLDVATWEAVCALLSAPGRGGANVHTGGRKYLLAGIVRCECGTTMHGNADAKRATFNYQCRSCGIGISGPKTDRLVERLVLGYYASHTVTRETEPWASEGDLADAEQRITALMDSYTSRQVSGERVFPAVEKLEIEVTRLRNARAQWMREQITITSRPTDAANAWRGLDTDQQRALVAGVLVAVVVRRAAYPGSRFDPLRLEPIGREGVLLPPIVPQ